MSKLHCYCLPVLKTVYVYVQTYCLDQYIPYGVINIYGGQVLVCTVDVHPLTVIANGGSKCAYIVIYVV